MNMDYDIHCPAGVCWILVKISGIHTVQYEKEKMIQFLEDELERKTVN